MHDSAQEPQTPADDSADDPEQPRRKSSPDRRRQVLRAVKVMAKIALAILIVLGLVHTALTGYFGMKFRAELTAARQQGGPLKLTDAFRLPGVKPQENAAPLYLAAYALMHDDDAYKGHPTEDDPDLAAKREATAKDRDAIQLVLKASQRPKIRFQVEWERGYATLLPHLQQCRGLARMLSWAAAIAAEDDSTEEAYRLIEAGFRMGRHIGAEPCLISQLVRYAVDDLVISAARRALAKAPPKGSARPLGELLDVGNIVDMYAASMRGERACGLDAIQDRSEHVVKDIGATPFMWSSYLMRPVQHASGAEYLRCMARLIAEASEPVRLDTFSVERAIADLPFYAATARILVPALGRTKLLRDNHIAKRGLLRTAIGLEVYRSQKGAYPDSLAALKATLNWPDCEDVFSGKDYVYRRDGDRFVLYSLGPDLDDDNGRPMWQQVAKKDSRNKPKKEAEEGDLVWIPYGRLAEFRSEVE